MNGRSTRDRNAVSADERHLAIVDLDDIYRGSALSALLARGADFVERDLAVESRELRVPERRTNCFRIGLAGFRDGGRDRLDAIVAAKSFGEPCERIAALSPFSDERFRR